MRRKRRIYCSGLLRYWRIDPEADKMSSSPIYNQMYLMSLFMAVNFTEAGNVRGPQKCPRTWKLSLQCGSAKILSILRPWYSMRNIIKPLSRRHVIVSYFYGGNGKMHSVAYYYPSEGPRPQPLSKCQYWRFGGRHKPRSNAEAKPYSSISWGSDRGGG